jgi:phage shock protein A
MSESPDEPIIDAEVVNDHVDDHAAIALPSSEVPDLLATDYTNDGTPTFDYVRDRIEGRVATSLGATELTANTPQAASVEDQFAAREKAGRDRLEEIRRSMRKD